MGATKARFVAKYWPGLAEMDERQFWELYGKIMYTTEPRTRPSREWAEVSLAASLARVKQIRRQGETAG